MDCTACHETKHALFCSRCLKQGLKNHTEANHILTTQLKASRTRCERILVAFPGIDAHRQLAADIHALETQNTALEEHVRRSSTSRTNRLTSLRARKEDITRRRRSLCSVRPPDAEGTRETIASTQRTTRKVAEQVTHARRILVREALDVFALRPVDEDWEIAGLRMPLPARFTEYPSTHLNATFDHLVHLLGLITAYLDVQLPFVPQWQGLSSNHVPGSRGGEETPQRDTTTTNPRSPINAPNRRTPHIGKIFLSATPALPFIHLPPSPSTTTDEPVPILQKRAMLYVSSSRDKWRRRQRKLHAAHPGEPEEKARDKHRDKEDHLNLAYSMLLLDLLYLGKTQGVSSPNTGEEAQVNPLRLLHDLAHSEELGTASHAPPGTLYTIVLPCHPTALHAAVVKAFAEDPPLRARERRAPRGREREREGGELGGDDWDLV